MLIRCDGGQYAKTQFDVTPDWDGRPPATVDVGKLLGASKPYLYLRTYWNFMEHDMAWRYIPSDPNECYGSVRPPKPRPPRLNLYGDE